MPNEMLEIAKLAKSDAAEVFSDIGSTARTAWGVYRHGIFSRYTFNKATGYIGGIIKEQVEMAADSAWTSAQDATSELVRLGTGGMLSGEDMMDAGRVALGFDTAVKVGKSEEVIAATQRLTAIRAVEAAKRGVALPGPEPPVATYTGASDMAGGYASNTFIPSVSSGKLPPPTIEMQSMAPEVKETVVNTLREIVEEVPEMESEAWDFSTPEGLDEISAALDEAQWEAGMNVDAPAPYIREGDTWLQRVTTPIEEAWGEGTTVAVYEGTGITPLGQALYNDIADTPGDAIELMEMRGVRLGTITSDEIVIGPYQALGTSLKDAYGTGEAGFQIGGMTDFPGERLPGIRDTPEEFDVEEFLDAEAEAGEDLFDGLDIVETMDNRVIEPRAIVGFEIEEAGAMPAQDVAQLARPIVSEDLPQVAEAFVSGIGEAVGEQLESMN